MKDGAVFATRYFAAGVISRAEAEARLEQAALAAGMRPRTDGIATAIKSGLEAALA